MRYKTRRFITTYNVIASKMTCIYRYARHQRGYPRAEDPEELAPKCPETCQKCHN